MKLVTRGIVDPVLCSLLAGLTAMACSAASKSNGNHGTGAASGAGAAAAGSGGSSTSVTGSGGALSLGTGAMTTTGTGLGCKTTVSGTVYDPAGTLPLYDVVVYVPSVPLTPIAAGASCATCDSYFSGMPVAATLSDASGNFTMDVSGISSATNVPLVVQVGKWQRQVTVPSITACGNTALDKSLTRLPANQSEGNLPQIAMVRGGSDALECLIRKLGVSDSEFTTDSGTGRVHL
jgi:hypothetical protein